LRHESFDLVRDTTVTRLGVGFDLVDIRSGQTMTMLSPTIETSTLIVWRYEHPYDGRGPWHSSGIGREDYRRIRKALLGLSALSHPAPIDEGQTMPGRDWFVGCKSLAGLAYWFGPKLQAILADAGFKVVARQVVSEQTRKTKTQTIFDIRFSRVVVRFARFPDWEDVAIVANKSGEKDLLTGLDGV